MLFSRRNCQQGQIHSCLNCYRYVFCTIPDLSLFHLWMYMYAPQSLLSSTFLFLSTSPSWNIHPNLCLPLSSQVRFASLGLGAALSSVPSGCQALCASCQNISGGLWGTLLNILLDQQESSMVRREVQCQHCNSALLSLPPKIILSLWLHRKWTTFSRASCAKI